MNLAKPARPSTPPNVSVADACESVAKEYTVEEANLSDDELKVAPAERVEPAELVDDPRKFAPLAAINEPHKTSVNNIPLAKLRETGVDFEGPAAVSRGLQMTFTRRVLPFLYDERDFISYGEALRYIAVKDCVCFVYTDETSPTPIFSIPLSSLQAVKEDPKKPHKRSVTVSPMANSNVTSDSLETILLLDAHRKLAYQFTFDISLEGSKDLGERFQSVITNITQTSKIREKVDDIVKK